MVSGSWFGTNRMEILAEALLAMTVFAPSPVYPPQIPLTSNVGRMLMRSGAEYPFSPSTAPIAMLDLYSSSSNGASAIAVRSSAAQFNHVVIKSIDHDALILVFQRSNHFA